MAEISTQPTQESYRDLFTKLSLMIARSSELSDMVHSAVHIIQSVLNVENCSVLLMDADETELVMAGSSVIPPEAWNEIRIPLGHGVAGRVALTGKPMLVSKSQSVKDPSSDPHKKKYQTDSFISIPLRSREQQSVMGVLNITDRVDSRRMTELDLDMLQSIGEVMAGAIQNHRVWERTRASGAHLTQVIEGLPIGIFTITAAGRLNLCNRSARRYLGLTETAELNRPWRECFTEIVAMHVERALKDLEMRQSAFSEEFEIPVDGGEAIRSVRISALQVEDIPALESHQSLFLIEDLNQMQEVMELRRSHKMKSNFLSLISHELRTPLAAIKGAIHLLNQIMTPQTNESCQKLFQILHRNTDRLARVLNNVLDVMDLEAGSLSLYRKRTDLHALVNRIAERFQTVECDKDIHWSVDLRARHFEIYVDESRVGQVVDHILENAVKFATESSEIHVASETVNNHWQLQITNLGRTIDIDVREKIFSKFYQVDASLTREAGGSGVGLFLCREIMRLHDGEVRLDPEFTGGARFIVSLPEATSLV